MHLWSDWPDASIPEYERLLRAGLEEAEDRETLILSSELLEKVPLFADSPPLEAALRAIHDLGYEIHILYVVRRYDHIMDSIFKQWVRDFQTKFCGCPADLAMSEGSGLMFATIAEKWRGLPFVKNVTALPFAEGQFPVLLNSIGEILAQLPHRARK
jgi:hypothetical protein